MYLSLMCDYSDIVVVVVFVFGARLVAGQFQEEKCLNLRKGQQIRKDRKRFCEVIPHIIALGIKVHLTALKDHIVC